MIRQIFKQVPLWIASCAAAGSAAVYLPANLEPPEPIREFRGLWVATVKNIDWPSRPGLSTEQQKSELLALLDLAVLLKLNAVILQVRPGCDALYASTNEPWSEVLTGRMGAAPRPFYDPLSFAVEQAHQRGIELHAWFNPFRAYVGAVRSAVSASHVSKRCPQLVRNYGPDLWLDPGEPAVQDYSLRVILDVVRRYDIDGVHLDDYFYPYPEKTADGKWLDFPDASTWRRYLAAGGKLNRGDWRRENVDRFVERLSRAVKAEKSFVKFGISPFGIWRPGHPAAIKGLDAYNELFADSRKWLAEGWVDYLCPQLYWPIDAKEQSYPVLLRWWADQNVQSRHLWPGNDDAKIGLQWNAQEIINQIRLTRQQPGASGNAHWSGKALLRNRGGICDALRREVYTQPALVPDSPWLGNTPPAAPKLAAESAGASGPLKLSWEPANPERVWLWVLQTKAGDRWTTEILCGAQTSRRYGSGTERPEGIALTAIDRCGNASAPAALARTAP